MALREGQVPICREGNGKSRRRKLAVDDAVGNDLNRKALGVADSILAVMAVTHHAGKLHCLGDPTAVVFPIDLNRQLDP